MQTGTCPKCRGTNVYRQPADPQQIERITLKGGLISKAGFPDRYVCIDCGYLEMVLASPADLELIKRQWQKV